MIYPNLKFPKKQNRPFFFTNFVSTIDGKVQVLGSDQSKNEHSSNPSDYWPIGDETDFQTLLDLRAASDIFIHGKNTALGFNHLGRIHSPEFRQRRQALGKTGDLQYMVITGHPDDSLLGFLKDSQGEKAFVVTAEEAKISPELESEVKLVRLGKGTVDIHALSNFLYENNFLNVLVEGGPSLIADFLKQKLLDEIFLTIAPKIFGNTDHQTLTLIEGYLFPAEQIPKAKLISVKQIESELFLRYEIEQ